MTENNAQPQVSMQINSQYIKDLSFEAPNMPLTLKDIQQMPDVKIDIDLMANKTNTEKNYTVDLTIRVKGTNKADQKSLFLCELTYGAAVMLDAPQELIETLLLVEVPRLLFPYARAIVGNTMREAGFPSLQINPIDFMGLYLAKKNEKNQTEGAKA